MGIGDQENARDTPEAKSDEVSGFPWGAEFPPSSNNVGNYGDSTAVRKGENEDTVLDSYDDGALITTSVMRYPANKLGIHDLGGNVWEWCQALFEPSGKWRVLRGGSWRDDSRLLLRSSLRIGSTPVSRLNLYGFRCVVVMGGSPKSD